MRKQNKDQSKTQASGCPKGEFIWCHTEQQTVLFSLHIFMRNCLFLFQSCLHWTTFHLTGRDIPYLRNAKEKTLLKNRYKQEPELSLWS